MASRRTVPPIAAVLLAAAPLVLAQDGPIQDNSFLLEEAYNQERGVVQHISTYTHFADAGDRAFSFTQEWPAPGQAHQLSFTLPYLRLAGGSGSGLGDVALNYRYQLVGSGDTTVAVAPRASLVIPTGEWREGKGTGAVSLQANLPVSVVLGPSWVAHFNLGATHSRGAKDPLGNEADVSTWSIGQSFVWLARPKFNALAEFALATGENVIGPDTTERFETFFINPGVRWAHDLASGLQIVPGIAAPIGVGPSRGDHAIFLYLSFEHAFR